MLEYIRQWLKPKVSKAKNTHTMALNLNRLSNSTATKSLKRMASSLNTNLSLLRLWMGLGTKVYILNALTALKRWWTGLGAKSTPSPTNLTSYPTSRSSTSRQKDSSHRNTRSRSGGSSSSTGCKSTRCRNTESSSRKTKPKSTKP